MLNYELCAIEFSFKHVAFFISAYVEQKGESLLVNNSHVSASQTEILSQRLSAKDEELKAITLKSNVLLEDVMNVANKLSEMQRQQLKVVESC